MRKLVLALALTTLGAISTRAQNCNADFSVQFLSWNTIKLSPALSTDSALTQHYWVFGDGNVVTNIIFPTHSYTPGVYTVKHYFVRHNNSGAVTCTDSAFRVINIVPPCNLTAAFTFSFPAANPRELHFTNTSISATPNDSIRWTFGDGTSSNAFSPVHLYAQPGVYNVCLRIQKRESGNTTSCVSEICHTVTIIASSNCNFTPHFTAHPDSINHRKVYFNNSTAISNLNAATWNFGDGTTANTWNAIHEYAQPGRYYVCLTIVDGTCLRTTCDSITVTANSIFNCAAVITNFYERRDSILQNRIHFTAFSSAPILDQLWTIKRLPNGPVLTLHTNNPTYFFQDTGRYLVCLRALHPYNCVKEICHELRIEAPMPNTNPCNMQVYPNPAHTIISAAVNLTGAWMIHAYIYNSMGTLVRSQNFPGVIGNNIVTFNIQTLPPGMYTIRLQYEGHQCSANFYHQQ